MEKLCQTGAEAETIGVDPLHSWSAGNTAWLTKPGISWTDILKVCRYFLAHPRPQLYIRQLPIEVHTKFIEEHSALLQSLLDFLIPSHIRDAGQKRFAERYFLKYDEPLIRIRSLDAVKQKKEKVEDISIPLSAFRESRWEAERVLITENKMNFLTLPPLPSTISVWSGGGFQVGHLRDVRFLEEKNMFYWGDIDEHGFQILHQLRSYYPSCQSIMMDRETFDRFSQFAVAGARNKPEVLPPPCRLLLGIAPPAPRPVSGNNRPSRNLTHTRNPTVPWRQSRHPERRPTIPLP